MPQGFSEDGQEKGKKKKWWGELFKRRNRKVSDSSSDEDEEDGKRRGFLRRKKHDRGSKDVTNSFVINPGIKQDRGRSLESVRSSGDRTIDRTSERSTTSKRRIKAKVEASREQLKDSSSDEGSSYTSSLPSGGSFPRRSRIARTERHNRRQLWSASVVYQESNDYDTKFRAKARSATPSPAASPKVKPRAASQDSVAPPPPPRRMEIPKYQPPVYIAPNIPRYKPRYNGLPHHSSDPVIPKDWNEVEEKMPAEEKKPPAPPRRQTSQEERKRQAHLEEALNELEAIYKKLEDLQDAPSEKNEEPRAEDDMAYRKLNKRETSSQDIREILSQAGSYLLISPTLSPPAIVPSSPNGIEPDVTYDDVVYRTVNHSNNSLKCLDPQPLFGIPLGPISPAPSSDYLHAKPNQFELKPPDEPDVVTDDLAFRNLRKDNQELRKKKAVRSLSANLSNVIFRNNNNISSINNNNLDNKSQSYSDIPEEMRLAQRVLDMRRAKKNETKNNRPQLPRVNKEDMRRKFFADVYDNPSETDLLKELEDEARATSLEIEQQLSKQKPDALYSRSMTDLLEELTKNLDYDFGQATNNASCQTCGDSDTSKISRGSSSFHSHASPPMKAKTVARAASHHDKPDSPKVRNKLQNVQNASGQIPPCIKDRPRFPLPHEQKENAPQEEKKSFTPYRSPNNSIRILRDTCENLPKIRKKVDSPKQWENVKPEEQHSRTASPRNPSPRSSNALDELFTNLSHYKPESPKFSQKTPARTEQRSASLKIQSETPRPWEANFKGRSDSYHGPMQMRSGTPKHMEGSPNSRRRISNSSPKRMECSPNNSFRRRTPSPSRHNFRTESPSQWERSLDELCKFQEPFFHPVQQVQHMQHKRESPRPWLSRQSPIEREGTLKEPYRLSPQPMKSQSPKPWLGYLNNSEGQQMHNQPHYPLSVRKDVRDGARSPKHWPMPLSVGRSLDEGSYLASERLSPKPRWSSVRERVLNEQFNQNSEIIQPMHPQPYRRDSPKNWQPPYPPSELCQMHEYLQRASPKRLSQETLQVPDLHGHRPMNQEIHPQHSYNRESPKRMMELAIQRVPNEMYHPQSYHRESPKQLLEHPLQRNLSNEILNYGYQRESPSQMLFEMRRHSNDEGYRRASPRQMVSEHGQRVVNSQLLNQVSYKRDTPSPRWGSMEEKHSPPLKIKHPAPWRHSIASSDRADMGRQSPQSMRQSPVRIQRSPVRDEPSRLTKCENARTWEDLNSFYNKLSESKKKASPSWESLDGSKEVKSSPELKINELTVGFTESERPKTPESPRRRGSSPKDLSPSMQRKEFGNQLGVIGENRVVRRESQSRIESPVRLYRSSSSREDESYRRSPPARESFVDRVFPPDDSRNPLLFNSSPIDVAAMEAESEEEKDSRSGQEEYVGRCDRGGMVGPTQNMSSATKDERIARYKEERRRQLAAQFGPRDNHQQPLGAIRSTRASRLRTQANSESIKGSKDLSSKDVDSPTYFPKSRLIKPSSPQLPDVSIESYQKKCTMVSPNVGGVCSPRGAKKPSTTTTPPSSSPIPRSAQLVKRASLHERESSPVSAIPLSQSPREPTNGISCSSPSISSTTISSGNVTPLRVSTLLITGRQSPPSSPSPTRHPSILKKSSIEEVQVSSNLTAPVSILKRKTSGDTTNSARCHSPLRFSPNTVDKKGRGILKKHRSLDETQVVNGNLEVTNGVHDTDEPRPILKGQPRRCSLEEVVKRTLSPEPQGILKRKASREETEVPTENILHPHGILKKKSSVTEEPAYESLDCPRPILKKKSSSEEEEYIKSILKVSSRKSLEGDDAEQKKEDIKPILKHSDEVVLRPKKTNSEKRVTSLDLSLFCRPGSGGEGRPPSVAERVNGLEILLNIKKDELSMRMEEGDGNTTLVRRGSVNERASLFNQIDEKEKAEAEASKTRRTLRGPRNRSRTEEGSRFRTQPVTFDEVEQAKRNNDPDCEDPSNLSLAQRVKLFSSLHSTEKLNSGGTTPVAVTPPQPAPRKLLSSPLMSGVLVEGLMKNLAGKDGAPVKIRIGRSDESAEDSSSSESSDSEVDGEIGDGACRRLLGGGETVGFRRREESSSEEASSGGREVQDILRRQTTVKKSNSSAGEMLGEVTLRRCATQPISRDEVDDLPKTTIAERLAALRKNGNTNWMKRIDKPIEEIISAKPPSGGGSRVTERLGQLETASQEWKTRVGPQDAQQFTVAGKMSSESPALPPVPVLGMASRKPTPIVFTNKGIASASVPSVPDSLAELMKRSISVPEGDEDEGSTKSAIKVPQPYDEDFAAFFPATDLSRLTSDGDVDLDAITIQSHDLLVQRRTVRVQRKHRSANPIKALQNRTDIKTEYVEVKSGVAEREIRRMNIEKLPKNCGLAVEALAALASKEDITGVALRKAGEGSPATRQWTHPLLLRIKGRRHPLTSVIRPHYSSINQGDSFVLVTHNQVFHWIGEFCNVIEKSRGADIAQHIETEKDLGCTGATNVITLDGSSFSEKHRQFWKLLSLPDDMMSTYNGESAGHPGEDEVYEKAVSETYMAYELDDDKLLPVSDFWGRCPKIEVLDSSKVLVFDFTTEVYMWAGKNADMSHRRKGTELAQKLYRNVCEAHVAWKATGIPWLDREMESKNRPEYSVFARITQHMEPIVFKEKFLDWPDFTKVIRSASSKNVRSSRKVDGSVDARPCDAQAMIAWSLPPPDLVLEGTHLGRGDTYYDPDRMLHYDVSTQELLIWTMHGSNKVSLPPSSIGHFLDTESYIIRWKYNVKANARELSGLPSKHTDVGRDRLAYFVWHGTRAPVVEQGTAALLTACPEDPEDAEHGPISTLRQGGDCPAFAAMFPGPIVFHNSAFAGSSRLFLITGEEEGEVRLEEVEASPRSLRSRASLLLVDTVTSSCYLWHGAKCPTNNRKVASSAVSYLMKTPAKELRLIDAVNTNVTEIDEGEEPEDFFGGLGLIDRQIYSSLIDTDISAEWTPRLFHLSSIYGDFTASPVIPLRFNPNRVTPYPYSKEDLYSTSQPSLMLLDLDNSLYLWTGWMEGDVDSRGSVWGRHGAERIASLTTSLHYWDLRGKSPRDVHIVCAGLEPPQFKAAFAVWGSSAEDEVAREFNFNEGHTENEMKSVQDELRGMTRTYPISELTALPLPAGVDPTRLEEYLTDQDFESLLDVSKEEFKELPTWKQTNLKKKTGLF